MSMLYKQFQVTYRYSILNNESRDKCNFRWEKKRKRVEKLKQVLRDLGHLDVVLCRTLCRFSTTTHKDHLLLGGNLSPFFFCN